MLNVSLTGTMSGFSQMLNSAKTQAQAFTNSVTKDVGASWGGIGRMFAGGIAGMFTFEAVKGFAENVLRTGDEIKALSEQMNMGADDVQKWSKAVDRAHLSMNGLQNIVAKFQELKETAKTGSAEGVQAREKLNALGVSNDDILTESGFSGEQIAKLLGNADQGAGQRSRLADVIGTRGLKYGAAAKFFGGAQADWDKGDLELMEQAEDAERAWKRQKTKMGVGMFKVFTDKEFSKDYSKQFSDNSIINTLFGGLPKMGMKLSETIQSGGLKGLWKSFLEAPSEAVKAVFSNKPAYEKNAIPYDKKADRQRIVTERYAKQAEEAAAAKEEADRKRKADAGMRAYQKSQEQAFESQKQNAQFQLHRAQGGLLTIGDRKAMIRGDLATLSKEIASRDGAVKAGKLYGLTDEEDAADKEKSASEHKKKLQAQELELMQKQSQAASMQAELKEKPLSFNADSMSKVGLYSASAMTFNPLLGVAQKQLTALEKIAANTSGRAGGNHFRP